MAANRKLVQLVDSTLKKVDEGLEEFDEMWTKVEECTNPNQRVCRVLTCDIYEPLGEIYE